MRGTSLRFSEDPATLNLAKESLAEDVAIIAPSFGIPMSKDDLYRIYDEALAKYKTLVLKKQKVYEEEMLDELSRLESTDILQKEIKTVKEHDLPSGKIAGHFSHSAMIETELEQAIKSLKKLTSNRSHSFESAQLKVNEIVEEKRFKEDSVLTNSTHSFERRATVSCFLPQVEIADKHQKTLRSFDFREEFKRRFRSKKIWELTVMKLPVIGRPRQSDVVQSYRRKGLFDNVEYRKPILMHEISLHNVDSTEVTVVSEVETEKLRVKEVSLVEENTVEPNNNRLTTDPYIIEKITSDGLLEKPVGSISPCLNRRSSVII
ncbi:unnamed protein product [Angiostrongylus costaricensis]|uniref:Reverse transcriptase domain-containing protein n=1 Tax=Angiostrongylus costaricensis TaxID=334426 RepID=A0A0R3PGB6_ANGCS|nr:unnamed protein product [Angiostrongylus costaricensis]